MPIDNGTATGTTPASAIDTADGNTETIVETSVVDEGKDKGEGQESLGDVSDTVEFTIEDLLDADLSDYEEFAEGVNHKGMKPLAEVMKHMVPEGRQHIANMRSMMTRKTQELAQLKRTITAEREALNIERDTLYNGKFKENVEKLAAEPEVPHDVFDETGMNAKIQQEAAKLMQAMLKPLQEEQALATRQSQVTTFKAEHPDLTENRDIKAGVYKMLKTDANISLENAYYIVKAKFNESAAQVQAKAEREAKEERRSTLKRTSTGSNSNAKGTPRFKSAWEALQYHKSQGIK